MRLGFFPLLMLTVAAGLGAGAAVAYSQSSQRAAGPAAPAVVSPAAGQASGAGQAASSGGSVASPAAGDAAQRRPGGGTAVADGAANPARAVTGAVSRIEGNQITITTPQGPQTVTVADGTTFQRAVPATLGDLKAGDRVLITTRPGENGALSASGVQILAGPN
ncbi:MAG: hypothetical protein U0556_01810 [Dehalococcoidia bacterium]